MSRTYLAVSLLAGLAAATSLGSTAIAGTDDPAHTLADKFARAGTPSKAAKTAREQPDKPDSSTEKADAERRRAQQLEADEAEMLARARAEAEEARRSEIEAAHRQTSGIAHSPPGTAPEPADTGAAPAETLEALEARRQAESDAVAARLRRTRAALSKRINAHRPAEPAPEAASTEPVAAPARAKPADFAHQTSSRVTVLLVIDHGTKGIRRFDTTGDPILCIGDACFIGAGADKPSTRLPRHRALGVGNTLGKRAGACSHSLSCVLREINLGSTAAVLQPVDLRVLHHDRRDPIQVRGDSDCTIRSAQLTCRFAVRGRDWRAWIVPEPIAAQAGPSLLQSAIEDGLGATRALASQRN